MVLIGMIGKKFGLDLKSIMRLRKELEILEIYQIIIEKQKQQIKPKH